MKIGRCAVALALWVATAIPSTAQNAVTSCNGSPEFCRLRFNEISLAGSHSAGSGSSGPVRTCAGGLVNYCPFHNQNLNISQQLDLGIRFLALDICRLPANCDSARYGDDLGSHRLLSCQGATDDMVFSGLGYGESLMKSLRDIDSWMRDNPSEVIGLRFTREVTDGNRAAIVNALVPLLVEMWGEGTSNSSVEGESASSTEMSSYYSTNLDTWPTLGEAVSENKRIIVFLDNIDLYTGNEDTSWVHPTPFRNAAVTVWNQKCLPLLGYASQCENRPDDEYLIAVAYTRAICIDDGQNNCNTLIQEYSNMCYMYREQVNRTVNVVLVDYPELGTGNQSVFNVVAALNARNVKRFLEPTTSTTMSTPVSLMTDEQVIGSQSPTTSTQTTSAGVSSMTFMSTSLIMSTSLGTSMAASTGYSSTAYMHITTLLQSSMPFVLLTSLWLL